MVNILMLETVGLLVKPAPNARNIRLINKVRGSRIMPPINKLKFLVSHVITVAPNAPHQRQTKRAAVWLSDCMRLLGMSA